MNKNWQFYSARQKMLEKNNELFTNSCLLLMVWIKTYKSIIIAKWFSDMEAGVYINTLITTVIIKFQDIIIADCSKLWVNIQSENWLKKLDF